MKKIVLGLLLIVSIGGTTAYTNVNMDTDSGIMLSNSHQSIYSIPDNLQIDVVIKEVITTTKKINDGNVVSKKTKKEYSLIDMNDNLSLFNNSENPIEKVHVNAPFNEYFTHKKTWVNPDDLDIEMSLKSGSRTLKKLLRYEDSVTKEDMEIKIFTENGEAVLNNEVSLDVEVQTERITKTIDVTPPKVILPAQAKDSTSQ